MSVSNFEDKNYTEQQGTIQLSTLGSFANGINYGAGYVEFAVSQNGDSGDYLRLTSASNPNANGAVSITGSVVYLGNGTSKIQIGTVDTVNDGQAGHALRINFDNVSIPGTSPVVNGDFSRTNGNSSNIPGWTAVTQHIDLGVTKIAGWATPEAPLIGYPSNTPGGNDNDLLSGFDAPEVKVTADGRLLLQETGLTSTPFGVVHGPAAYSDVFAASAGMVLKFDWTANNVSDDYHVVGYLLNADTGAISIALQGWGTTGSGIGSVGVPANGNYRFVFVSGSYDKTGGQALGASMYIDNIRVETGAITDAVVQTLARQVVYENTSDNPAATKTVTVSAKNINGTVSTDALNISVTQVNDAPVKTSTVALANGTEDVLYTVSKASLLAGFSDPDGDVMSVTGLSASQGTVTANADGSFSVSQAANFNGNVTLQYTVSDGHGGSLAASKTFLVAPVNDAPVAAPDSGMATVGGATVSIDVLANDTDVDAGDTKTLVSVNTSGTTGNVSIANGKVSYDPAAAFQALGAGATATDTFTYTMKDSAGATSTATVTMTVTGVNDAPVAVADSGAASEDGGAVVVDVLGNDTDVDAGDTKTLVSVNAAGTVGSVSIVDGKVSYDPGAHFQSLGAGATATDTFSYTMKDSAGVTSTATVTMTITGVNDGPVAVANSGAATEDGGAVVIDVLANDTDVDAGDTKTLVSVNTAGTAGSVSIVDGKVSYDPGTNFQSLGAGATATDTFTYTMKDSAGATSTATVTMTITGVNDGPVAVADSGAASEDGNAVVVDVLANDTDADAGDTKTLVSVNTSGTTGSVSIVDGKVSYDPGARFQSLGAGATATDTFSYTMKDSAGVTSTATVTMTVTGTNDGPAAVADSGAAAEDGGAVVIDVLANDTDVDAGDTRTLVSVNTAGTVGSVSIVDGKVSYDPGTNFQSLAAGATATDPFTYTMKDSAGATSTATVTMTITGTNDGPVSVADSGAASEDGGAVVVDVLGNDTDVDAGDTKTLVSVSTAGTVGSVSIVDGKVSYDPGAHFQSLAAGTTATDTFTYMMKDSAGATSTATVTMTVTGTNDGPAAVADSGAAIEDGGAVVIDVLSNDTDVDAGDTKTLVSVSTSGTTGSVSIVDGKVSYDPGTHFQSLGAGATATDTFSYTMKDSAGATSTATVTMTITGTNDGPVSVADSGAATEDGKAVVIDVLANDTDVDAGDTKTLVSVNTAGTVGSVSIVDGKVSYDPGAHFQSLGAGATATDTFTYTMKDSAGATSTATVTMTVTGVNDGPVAVADKASVSEDGAIVVDVLANDTDVDAGDSKALVSVNTSGTVGSVSIVDGKVSYNPGAAFQSLGAGATATDTFTYTMKDSAGVTSTATVTMTINGVNDGPVAVADSGAASEDGKAVVIDVLANDTDADAADTKTLVSVNTAGTTGSVSIVDGKVSYDPGAHFQSLSAGATATDTFTYTMKDSAGATSTQTVTMTVTGVNDGPVAVADSGAASEDGGAVVIDVLANDTDVDAGDTKTLVSVSAAGTTGSVSIVDGKVKYDPGTNFQSLGAGVTATDTFTYTMKDTAGATSTATVTMTITGVNDAPVAVADSATVQEKQTVTINVLANDTDIDAGDVKLIAGADSVSKLGGTVSIVNGALQYSASADTFDLLGLGQSVTDSFSYTMKDAKGALSSTTVTVKVMGAADGANIVGTVKDDAGATALVGTALDEHIYGDNGSDELFGNGGSDHLFGENGEDTLDGGNGIDFLDGGNGKDVLIGGRGSDVMTGGEGNDVFVFNKDSLGTDVDVITDFKVGNDILRLLDNLAIASTAKVDYNHDGVMDTEVVLSNGTHIELLGVSNLANSGLLLS